MSIEQQMELGPMALVIKNHLLRITGGESSHSCIFFNSLVEGAVESCLSSVVPDNQKVMILNNGPKGEQLQKICDSYGLGQLKYIAPEGKNIDLPSLEYVLDLHQDEISHIAFAHSEAGLGIVNPISEIGALAKKYNKEIIVNAADSFLDKKIEVIDDNVHFLIASVVDGISFVIARNESLKKAEETKARNFYFDLHGNLMNPRQLPESLLKVFDAKVKGIYYGRFA